MSGLDRPRVEYRTPEDLVRDVTAGLIRIPEFQRGFRWEAGDIIKLFDSVLRGFPIGDLVLWAHPAPAQTLHVGPLTVEAPATDTALWVIDGQQRIASLVGALTEAHRTTDTRFRVHLDLSTAAFHTIGARQEPPPTWLPVSLLIDTGAFLRWMRSNADQLNDDQIDRANEASHAIREYGIATYVVAADRPDLAVEIFVRLNTAGRRMTKADLLQALHGGMLERPTHDLRSLGLVTADAGFGALDEQLTLRCLLAYRGGDVFREEFGNEFATEEDAAATFRGVAAALREAVEFLRGAGVPHVKLLPYSHVLPILVRFVRLHGPPEGRSATLLRRWVWRGAVAGTRARGISVPDVREQVAAVDAASPIEAAAALLRRVHQFPDFHPELDKVHFSHAMTKLNVLGLLSTAPLDPNSGQAVDVARLLDHGTPLRPILAAATGGLAATMANRVVMPSSAGRALAQVLASAEDDVAGSHLVDAEAQSLLLAGDDRSFLRHRQSLMRGVIREHVARMAEWGARDGRSMTDLLRSVA